MKCPVVYFQDPDTGKLMWRCPNRMGTKGTYSGTLTRCWRYNCKGAKPPPPAMFCLAEDCNNIRKNAPGSLYCSDKCSKRVRDRRYRQKKKIQLQQG